MTWIVNWIRQWSCHHDIAEKETRFFEPTTCGGYVWQVERVITLLFCKKCGWSKEI